MSFGVTFGSIGDLIAVGQFACSLAQALNSSRGSSKEYQSLIKELESFNKSLLQVVALWQNYETGDELQELYVTAMEIVSDCRMTLDEFKENVEKKYGTALSDGPKGSWVKEVKAAGKKVMWIGEKDDVVQLRRKLQLSVEKINMLSLAAMGRSNKLKHEAQMLRVEAVHGVLQHHLRLAEEQKLQLQSMDKKLDDQETRSMTILTNVKAGITVLTQVGELVFEIRNILGAFQKFIILQQSPVAGLGTTWQTAPVILEDALGNLVRIPLELVNSWDMLETLLVKRFEMCPGHTKVLKGEYAIEDSRTGRDFERNREWNMCFRPGQKVDMSMVFSDATASRTSCPGCGTVVPSPDDSQMQCTKKSCGMWFRRIEEVVEENIPLLAPTQKPRSVVGPSTYDDLRDSLIQKPSKERDDQPRDFQRVRILSKRSRKTFGNQIPGREIRLEVDEKIASEEEPADRRRNLMHNLNSDNSFEEELFTIKCICDYIDDAGRIIKCRKCKTWQHSECFYHDETEETARADFTHLCADCKPRQLDVRLPTKQYRQYREEIQAHHEVDTNANPSILKNSRFESEQKFLQKFIRDPGRTVRFEEGEKDASDEKAATNQGRNNMRKSDVERKLKSPRPYRGHKRHLVEGAIAGAAAAALVSKHQLERNLQAIGPDTEEALEILKLANVSLKENVILHADGSSTRMTR